MSYDFTYKYKHESNNSYVDPEIFNSVRQVHYMYGVAPKRSVLMHNLIKKRYSTPQKAFQLFTERISFVNGNSRVPVFYFNNFNLIFGYRFVGVIENNSIVPIAILYGQSYVALPSQLYSDVLPPEGKELLNKFNEIVTPRFVLLSANQVFMDSFFLDTIAPIKISSNAEMKYVTARIIEEMKKNTLLLNLF